MPKQKKKKPYNGRDPLIVKIIQGITKAGVEPDRKKKADKAKCRAKVTEEE